MEPFVRIVVTFAALTGLVLFFAGEVSLFEGLAALSCAGAGTTLSVALHHVAKKHFAPVLSPRIVAKPMLALVPEFFVVGRELVGVAIAGTQRQLGDFVHQPFDFGTDDARSTTRRALTVIGVSLAPRTFVIRGEDQRTLLLHGLPPKALSPDTEWPA